MWYSIHNQTPTPGLPSMVRLPSGLTTSSLHDLSLSELKSIGITTVDDPPFYDINSQDLNWDSDTSSWSVGITLDQTKIDNRWIKLSDLAIKYQKVILSNAFGYQSDGGTLSTFFSGAIGILSGITSTNSSYDASNPFTINLLDQKLIGYDSSEYNVGIGVTEFRLVMGSKDEFYETYYDITDY